VATTDNQIEERNGSPSQHRNSQDNDFNNKGRKLRPASKGNRDSRDLRESNNKTNRDISSSLDELDVKDKENNVQSAPGSNNRRARSSLGG